MQQLEQQAAWQLGESLEDEVPEKEALAVGELYQLELQDEEEREDDPSAYKDSEQLLQYHVKTTSMQTHQSRFIINIKNLTEKSLYE